MRFPRGRVKQQWKWELFLFFLESLSCNPTFTTFWNSFKKKLVWIDDSFFFFRKFNVLDYLAFSLCSTIISFLGLNTKGRSPGENAGSPRKNRMVESQRVRNLLVFTLWDSPPSYFLTDFPSNCICSFMVWVRCPRERRHTFNPTIGTNLGREKSPWAAALQRQTPQQNAMDGA